jgi:hypothetical protein
VQRINVRLGHGDGLGFDQRYARYVGHVDNRGHVRFSDRRNIRHQRHVRHPRHIRNRLLHDPTLNGIFS